MKIKLMSFRMKPLCCMCDAAPFDMIRLAVRDDGHVRDVLGLCDSCDTIFMDEMRKEESFRGQMQ